MTNNESAIVKQWRQHLIELREYLLLEDESPEAKKRDAQRFLLISIASDEELEQMARLQAEFFSRPVDQTLNELREARERHRASVESWRGGLPGVQ